MQLISNHGSSTSNIKKSLHSSTRPSPPTDLRITVASPVISDPCDPGPSPPVKYSPSIHYKPIRRSSQRLGIPSGVAGLGNSIRRSASFHSGSPYSQRTKSARSPLSATFPRENSDSVPQQAPPSPRWSISRPDISTRNLSASSSSSSKKSTTDTLFGTLAHLASTSVTGLRARQSSSSASSSATPTPPESFHPHRSTSNASTMASVQMRAPSVSTRPPGTAHSNMNFAMGAMPTASGQAGTTASPLTVAQHIHDLASKRISTLDYLRKAHEGRIYWFNTILFTTLDLSKLSYFAPAKLARRATAYVLLGFSLPALLDLNGSSAPEYLRALNSLLSEFDSFLEKHGGSDTGGSSSGFGGSLSKGRVQQMFKRGMQGVSKGRRASAATDTVWAGIEGAAMGGANSATSPQDETASNSTTPLDPHPHPEAYTIQPATSTTEKSTTQPAGPFHPHASPFDPSYAPSLTGAEHHSHLLVIPLPFPPDYYQAFSTLCDCLIDVYTRIMDLVPSPEALMSREREGSISGGVGGQGAAMDWRENAGMIGELFAKTDTKVKKLLVAGVVREFEEASRSGVRGELRGVGRVVLGGLM
ncbi:hypothetical protein P152DRAFT_460665 [Eremomyces bilateralis CBS 781.70]|uniref:Uncharacterized protein n=1 Tax=Eremomyces bilateralis CBS 781.70 TaxID=1392243 RepID=A0A6G1FWK1_9PEZI|nr:uncharacterized protein P152DRAFT_460665 [Eremomyces bilateralis CBS 781.70]KAF1810163.1 hypothetical protein P152DRAFT_460665 [Eremomyces bilateralis CBS 781.70]